MITFTSDDREWLRKMLIATVEPTTPLEERIRLRIERDKARSELAWYRGAAWFFALTTAGVLGWLLR